MSDDFTGFTNGQIKQAIEKRTGAMTPLTDLELAAMRKVFDTGGPFDRGSMTVRAFPALLAAAEDRNRLTAENTRLAERVKRLEYLLVRAECGCLTADCATHGAFGNEWDEVKGIIARNPLAASFVKEQEARNGEA